MIHTITSIVNLFLIPQHWYCSSELRVTLHHIGKISWGTYCNELWYKFGRFYCSFFVAFHWDLKVWGTFLYQKQNKSNKKWETLNRRIVNSLIVTCSKNQYLAYKCHTLIQIKLSKYPLFTKVIGQGENKYVPVVIKTVLSFTFQTRNYRNSSRKVAQSTYWWINKRHISFNKAKGWVVKNLALIEYIQVANPD